MPVAPVEMDAAALTTRTDSAIDLTHVATDARTPSEQQLGVASSPTDSTERRPTESDAHFQSEQELFTHSPPNPEADQDFIDVASFLEMGHTPNCWCRPCQDVYSNADFEMPEPLDPTDDEWMMCSSASEGRSPSACSAWEWEWGTPVDDERDLVHTPETETDGEWECTSPSSEAHGAW